MSLLEQPDLDASSQTDALAPLEPQETVFRPPFEVLTPDRHEVPFVYNSPHSGRKYPPAFLARSPLDALAIRRSEDSFVDEIFSVVRRQGAPLLRALFPRAYLDANREPFELDPGMFADALPAHANTRSHRVSGGLGTIAKIVGSGSEIYSEKLSYAEAERRIRSLYVPYHDCLRGLLQDTKDAFGCAVLVDCHSMPSVGGPFDDDTGADRPDIVLGDRYGTSCAPILTQTAEATLSGLGYKVSRNNPYAGGYNTEHYGRPAQSFHALQIEINRHLYMDEENVERAPGLRKLSVHMEKLAAAMAAVDPHHLISPV
jgi:N-formylglutamate amidohydrolase